jgi:hypothetical protein
MEILKVWRNLEKVNRIDFEALNEVLPHLIRQNFKFMTREG